jgi:hypothetical protein
MNRPDLPQDLVALSARLRANPELTEGMGPVHMLWLARAPVGSVRPVSVSPASNKPAALAQLHGHNYATRCRERSMSVCHTRVGGFWAAARAA